jgi:hypothetical protein
MNVTDLCTENNQECGVNSYFFVVQNNYVKLCDCPFKFVRVNPSNKKKQIGLIENYEFEETSCDDTHFCKERRFEAYLLPAGKDFI